MKRILAVLIAVLVLFPTVSYAKSNLQIAEELVYGKWAQNGELIYDFHEKNIRVLELEVINGRPFIDPMGKSAFTAILKDPKSGLWANDTATIITIELKNGKYHMFITNMRNGREVGYTYTDLIRNVEASAIRNDLQVAEEMLCGKWYNRYGELVYNFNEKNIRVLEIVVKNNGTLYMNPKETSKFIAITKDTKTGLWARGITTFVELEMLKSGSYMMFIDHRNNDLEVKEMHTGLIKLNR